MVDTPALGAGGVTPVEVRVLFPAPNFMSFVHLHNHSYYSLLDGLGPLEQIAKAAKDQGAPAVGLTDHGVLYGAIDFYKACKKIGIKPIIGCEMYIAPRTRFDKESGVDTKPYHLILLATSFEGYQNLLQLVTKAHLEGFYYKPRVDEGLLRVYSKDLICLSGCLASETSRSILEKNDADTIAVIQKYQEIFGKENYFLELQDHPLIEEQGTVNKKLIELSHVTGAPLVATCDSHYVYPEDSEAHDLLLCIQTQTTTSAEDRMRLSGDFSLRTPQEMMQVFAETPEAVTNTVKIAERCNIEIPLGMNLIPNFTTPNGESVDEYLRALAYEGLHQRFGETIPQNALDQLEYELSIVHKMGFDAYFLIVYDFVKFAKDHDILVGPGRGSAAGSILSYALRITELDPLKYGLIFERFLNPERISMPDIDVDFADDRRTEVLDYVVQKYGRECVAQIITYGTMASRAAVRDVGRAMGYPYAEVDVIAKAVPPPIQGRHVPLEESVKEDPALRVIYDKDERAKKLLDMAMKLEGTVRHAGTHACAVVISSEPLVKYTALQFPSGGENTEIITQYSMKPIEEIGLLKMDFLGLKNLTILEKALEMIHKMYGVKIDLNTIPLDDAKTFELLKRGDTTGVFQLESAGMRRYLRDLEPSRFEDIIAMVALYRPGPMDWIPQYIEGKHHPEKVHYLDKSFESILKETHGVAVYQEQILQIARQFAGFSLGEADILRKAVGKKILKLLSEQQEKFIEGAVKQGHSKKFAAEVFEKVIEPFAGYGFNKAHAACYAMIAYQTAYLKANYPTPLMTALMTCDQGDMEKVAFEIQECEGMGVPVLAPSINESNLNFTAVGDNKIRFGLLVIKGAGEASVRQILAVREQGGPFTSLENLVQRVPVKFLNKKIFEALASSGALDEMGERAQLLENFENITTYAKGFQNSQAQGQTDLFALLDDGGASTAPSFHLKKVPPASLMDRLRWEKAFLGLYVTAHPLDGLKKYFSKKVLLLDKLTPKNVGKMTKLGGLVVSPRKIMTKAGAYMCSFTLEDPTGRIEAIVFPKVYAQYGAAIKEDSIVIVEGRLDLRRGDLNFSCNSVKVISLDMMIENAKTEGFYNDQEKVPKSIKKIALEMPVEEKTNDYGDDGPPPSMRPVAVETAEASAVGAVSNDAEMEPPYVIEVPEKSPGEVLQKLKYLLQACPGARVVELRFVGGEKPRKIRLPFQVRIDPLLLNQVEDLLGKVG